MTRFLSRTQAAQRCGRCHRSMRNLAKRGKGPPFGNRPAYPADALDRWLADNTHGAARGWRIPENRGVGFGPNISAAREVDLIIARHCTIFEQARLAEESKRLNPIEVFFS